jgi:bacteriorhodopsin
MDVIGYQEVKGKEGRYDEGGKEEGKDEKEGYSVDPTLKFSFTIAYILMLTTGTITFIESLRTSDPIVRHVMNLETAISVIAGYFYSLFTDRIKAAEEGLLPPVQWDEIVKTRYVDWSITTPIMLTVICMVMAKGLNKEVHFPLWISILILNYAMLGIGYAGEIGALDKFWADVIGFVPFVAIFGILYVVYIRPKYVFSNYLIYGLYIVVWSLYGIFYMLDDVNKNIAYNILDIISKCFVGIGLWVMFTKIIR